MKDYIRKVVICALIGFALWVSASFAYSESYVQLHPDYVRFYGVNDVRLYRLYYRPNNGFHKFIGPFLEPVLKILNDEIKDKKVVPGTIEWAMFIVASRYALTHELEYDEIVMITT